MQKKYYYFKKINLKIVTDMSIRIKVNKPLEEHYRYIKPEIKDMPDEFVQFENAEAAVNAIDFQLGNRVTAIVAGSFIFGDFIEAFLYKYGLGTKNMTLCTLSYSKENVDGLALLYENEYLQKLNLIVSDYFFSHERNGLIPYTYSQLDRGDGNFQLAIARTHMKTYLFETEIKGSKFVIQSSANLRSNGNSESLTMEINPQLYDFYDNYFQKILTDQKTIDHSKKYGEQVWKDMVQAEMQNAKSDLFKDDGLTDEERAAKLAREKAKRKFFF